MSLSDHTQPAPPDPTAPAAPPAAPAAPGASGPHSAAPAAEAPHAVTPDSFPGSGQAGEPVEIVPRGILFSLVSIPLGIIAAVVISRLGFIASISSFLIAGSAVFLYVKGATTNPRRGVVPLVGVILVGVAASFFAIVAADLVQAWDSPEAKQTGATSALDFVTSNLTYGPYLSTYKTDAIMFVVFAALGVFGTVRRLLGARKGF